MPARCAARRRGAASVWRSHRETQRAGLPRKAPPASASSAARRRSPRHRGAGGEAERGICGDCGHHLLRCSQAIPRRFRARLGTRGRPLPYDGIAQARQRAIAQSPRWCRPQSNVSVEMSQADGDAMVALASSITQRPSQRIVTRRRRHSCAETAALELSPFPPRRDVAHAGLGGGERYHK